MAKAKPRRQHGFERSPCPVAVTLDLLGDKWTLLVIRDLFLGKHTYGELLQSAEKIPTNILADRLKRLEKAGVVEKEPYQEHPVRYAYALTAKGRELKEVIRAIVLWANKNVPGTFVPDLAVLDYKQD
jgi:DNA-binding HxlR family transcriptional regulator